LKRIVITGGGTGGHLSIARALREELNRRGIKPIFIGSQNGQDRAWFGEDEGFAQKYFFDIRSVVDKKFVGKIGSMAAILRSARQCMQIFRNEQVDTIFSVGGYAAAPATIAAILQRKRYFIHEQNAVMGRLNALFARYADAVFSPFSENPALRAYPISSVFFENARLRTRIETIIFLGGSQGASAINAFAKQVAPLLQNRGIRIIHQSGSREYETLKRFYEEKGIDVDLFAFDKKLYRKIASADFAICRAGASTLWELAASQLPALYVPYPHAAGDHQYHNARFLAERNLSFVVRQERLHPDLMQMIFDADIVAMSEGLKGIVAPDAAAKIVDFMGY